MKTILLLLAFVVLFSSCEEETVYKVDTELQPYVDSFYQEASDRGKNFSKDNLIVALRNDVQAYTNIGNGEGQKYIYFSQSAFNTLSANQIEYEIFSGLSVIYLGKNLEAAIKGMPEFEDAEYGQSVYSEDTREEILDELFK
jgi:hypothetical protein